MLILWETRPHFIHCPVPWRLLRRSCRRRRLRWGVPIPLLFSFFSPHTTSQTASPLRPSFFSPHTTPPLKPPRPFVPHFCPLIPPRAHSHPLIPRLPPVRISGRAATECIFPHTENAAAALPRRRPISPHFPPPFPYFFVGGGYCAAEQLHGGALRGAKPRFCGSALGGRYRRKARRACQRSCRGALTAHRAVEHGAPLHPICRILAA